MYRFEFLHFVAVVLLFHSPLSAQEHSSEAMKFQYFKQDKTRTQRIVIQHKILCQRNLSKFGAAIKQK